MKHALPIAALLLLAPAGLLAQTTDAPADQASDATPDTQSAAPSDQATETPAPDTQSDAAPASDAPATGIDAHFTLDTPIKTLIADPGAKAVLDKDLPGLSTDENLDKFSDKSLRQFQPMTGGQLTDDLLKKTGADLAAIAGDDATASDTPAAPDDGAAATTDTSSDTTDNAAPPPDDKGKSAGNAKAPEGR